MPETNRRPPYARESNSSTTRRFLGSERESRNSRNDTKIIENAYNQIPSLSVNGKQLGQLPSTHTMDLTLGWTQPIMAELKQISIILQKRVLLSISAMAEHHYVIDLQRRWKLFVKRQDLRFTPLMNIKAFACLRIQIKSGFLIWNIRTG